MHEPKDTENKGHAAFNPLRSDSEPEGKGASSNNKLTPPASEVGLGNVNRHLPLVLRGTSREWLQAQ